MSLERIVLRKGEITLQFKVNLPLVGEKTVEETLHADESGLIIFSEPVQIHGIEYFPSRDKPSEIILHTRKPEMLRKVKPRELELPEELRGGRLEKIVEKYLKLKSMSKVAEEFGISQPTVQGAIKAVRIYNRGKIIEQIKTEDTIKAMVKDIDGIIKFVIISKDTAYFRTEESKILDKWMKEMLDKYRSRKYVMTDEDIKTLEKLKKYAKEEIMLKRQQ
ncbi:MAG: hypothetical protein DRJ18_02855 [Candidatus Methanomethylicota archaeon]|nr:MAG: hypothetical protein DRJ18_02855 [Candidatus Verstraetearchaeota archaeon]